jgi:hypothetical protein
LPTLSAVMMKLIFFLLFSVAGAYGYAQKTDISIQFSPTYDAVPVELHKKYTYKSDSIEIATLKFYISGIKLYQNDKPVDEVAKKYHLIDLENPASLTIYQPGNNNNAFNRVVFNIGINSITNVSGAFGGNLDPTNGMYWTWQSGYINFKLEGSSKLCPARKNQFTFHIGGYQYPNNCMQTLDLKVNGNHKIVIDISISQLLNELKLNELYEVMSPNEKAMGMAKKVKTAFSIAK